MHQIKIVYYITAEGLESKVNQWLEDCPHRIVSIDIKFTPDLHYATIVYQDMD